MTANDPSQYFMPRQEILTRLRDRPDFSGIRELLDDDEWVRENAEAGDRESMLRLGLAYADGLGVPQSDIDCIKWLKKSAEAGLTLAMTSLAAVHFTQPESSWAKGLEWLEKAANAGEPEAAFRLGLAYDEGIGTEPTPEESARWMLKAAQQNHREAMRFMALYFAVGFGIPKSEEMCQLWATRYKEMFVD